MTIYKYPIHITDRQTVMMPKGAGILCVQIQAGTPHIWVHCDPSKPIEPHTIDVYGTGHPMLSNPGVYIGTIQMKDGQLVWHVFNPKYTE